MLGVSDGLTGAVGVGDVACYEETDDFQTISTCPDGLACC